MIILIAAGAFMATLLGGLFAIKWSDKLHLVLGFSAGALVGVAFFDLLPEALEIGKDFFSVQTILLVVAIGFILYTVLDRMFFMHSHTHSDLESGAKGHDGHNISKGQFGAGSLSFHSFLDGIAIGIAFNVSTVVGLVVTAAVLAHDFSDGINTVSMILRHGGSKKQAFKWLMIDAIAPVLGILSTLFFTIPDSFVGLILALFCGFFLYIGASDLLPESHHNHPTHWTTFATVLGMATIYAVIHFAGI